MIAILLPKFGKPAPWCRWIGRVYAIDMLGMAALSVSLAGVSGSVFLMVIGLLTLGWVAGGWFAMRRYLHLRCNGVCGETSSRWLRSHLILMSASYNGAWRAFLVNIEPLGNSSIFYLYAFGPTVLGTMLIVRTACRYVPTAKFTTRSAARP